MLPSPFRTLDDNVSITENKLIHDLRNLPKVFTTSFFEGNAYYRPMVTLTYMLEYYFFGLNPFNYNLNNLLLHILITVCVFYLIQAMFQTAAISFFCSLLFAIHPVNWEAVANVSGRAILLCALFYVLTFYHFCRAKNERKEWSGLSLLFFALALLSKESALVLPGTLAAYLWFLKRPEQSRPSWTQLFRPLWPYILVEVVYLIWRQHLGMTKLFYWRNIPEAILGFGTFLRSAFTHVRLFILPIDLHFDRMRKLFSSFGDLEFLITVLAFLVCAGFLLRFHRKIKPVILFLIAWFVIELLPVAQIWVTIGVQPYYISTAEHFLYIPSIAAFVLLVLFVQWLYRKNSDLNFISKQIFNVIVGALLTFLFLTTIQQNIYAAHEIALFERSLQFAPDNARIRNCLALAYAKRQRFEEAEFHYRKVLELDPNNAARIGLGKALCDQGRYLEGVAEYDKITQAGRFKDLLDDNRRRSYQILIKQYQKKISESPQDPELYLSVGIFYSKIGEMQDAEKFYEKAKQLKAQAKP